MKIHCYALLLLATTLLYTSCPKQEAPKAETDTNVGFLNADQYISGGTADNEWGYANHNAIEKAFDLNYASERAEADSEVDTLSSKELSGALAVSSIGPQIIPGLRQLRDYKTNYYDPVKNKVRIAEIAALQAKAAIGGSAENSSGIDARNSGNLTMADWGPKDFLSSAVQRPSIYVIFSQPMIALSSLSEQTNTSVLLTITPPVKGVFRWYGTSFLSFEADEPLQSQMQYTVEINAGAKSVYGKQITGKQSFTFETERLAMKTIAAGEEWRKKNEFAFYSDEVPPAAAAFITIALNYPVAAADLQDFIEITTSQGKKQFSLSQINETVILASVKNEIEFNTAVRVTLKKGAKARNATLGSAADQTLSFATPSLFTVKKSKLENSWGKYKNIVSVEFSHRLNESTVLKSVRTEPAMQITKDNIEVWGSTVNIYNLPVVYDDKFKVIIDTSIEDVYGRKLTREFSTNITMPSQPPPKGFAYFIDSGRVILEAAYPRLLFEYKNTKPAVPSWYRIDTKNNPFQDTAVISKRIELPESEINYRYFEDIDLKPFLNPQGKGFLTFNANLHLLEYEDEWKNTLTMQVTDLGLTVRYAFNKTVVLVTSLKTGDPIAGATVKLIRPDYLTRDSSFARPNISDIDNFGTATTNANGLAVIETGSGVFRRESGRSRPYLLAEKDGDRVIFEPYSHNEWAFDVYAKDPQTAENVQPVTFMFSDRGIYKPGETLTFRGVDKTLILGNYAIYSGGYEVSLENDAYRSKKISTVTGTASDSGGFHGTITVPDDLEPGGYLLSYRRKNHENENRPATAYAPIKVAYFSRLKFQADITVPAVPIVNGEDINLTLNASYLSGGSLAGAKYNGSWYRELSYFAPQTAAVKNYRFGPRNVYDSRSYIGQAEGMLAANGSAALSQKTGEAAILGAPYTYTVEATVTDLSNQNVTAITAVKVHPAQFYIGLDNSSAEGGLQYGFAKAAEDISFNYITVNPNGEVLTGNERFLRNSNTLTVELIREEWKRVQQQGVNGYVYDRYNKENVVDSTQKIDLKIQGSFKVKPLQAGYHTVRVTAFDRDGKKVITEHGFYVTGSNWGYWNMNSPQELKLTPDKALYNPGDNAQILLQSSLPKGHYLITVEREGIFTQEVQYYDKAVSVIEVPIARNYVPVVYVSVASYSVRSRAPTHSYGTPDLDKPSGYFGLTTLHINQRVRAFSVKIDSNKKVFQPGDEVTMTLTAERDSKPLPNAELTLMAVDRGVLDLVNYHVPDPISYFYDEERFALKVKGGDSRYELMDPVTYSIKNLIGGDEGDKLEERSDFNPTAVFEPYLLTDENGKVTVKFKLPDTLTTYRVTVFGVRGDLFSLKESEIASQQKINVMQVQPRRLRERDTAEAGVLISNLDAVAHKISVALSVTPPKHLSGNEDDESGFATLAGEAFVDGAAEHTINLRSGENAVVYFDVAAVKQGTVDLNFVIKSDIVNERLISPVIIEKPYTYETVTANGSLSENTATEVLVIPSFADDGVGDIAVSLDATRLSLLESAVDYLFQYPYGCMEQRSAAILPLVIFGEYLDDFNLQNNVVLDPKKVVEQELKAWAKVQHPDGGFPYWPGGVRSSSNQYVSLRIAHIIGLAKEKKYRIPSSFNVDALYKYCNTEYQRLQNLTERNWGYQSRTYLQAYMLYVFSMLKEPVDASRIAEVQLRNKTDPCVLAFCGMAYQNLNRKSDAAATAQLLRNLLRPTTRGVDISSGDQAKRVYYHGEFYGGMVEQLALTLEFFVQQYPNDDINTRLLHTLMQNKNAGGYWSNTAVSVRTLSAINSLIKADKLDKTNVKAKILLDNKEMVEGTFKGLNAKIKTEQYDFKTFPLAGMRRDTPLPMTVTRQGSGNIYWTTAMTYALPPELQSVRDEGIGINLVITDLNTETEVKEGALESGKMYRARIKVSSNRDRTYLALRVPVPSGAEILDASFVTTTLKASETGTVRDSNGGDYHWISNQFILDNEIQYFWDTFAKGETTVQFLFHAGRRGVYPTPPVQAECMYEPEIFGRTGGLLYTIR
ncbi:MAG: alpha-2-macroglobulin family protein [Termitinemataceae bacterium]|nr:MAG: alpha-2-macroglobulin family protein [Termitinemataceae bacterium]